MAVAAIELRAGQVIVAGIAVDQRAAGGDVVALAAEHGFAVDQPVVAEAAIQPVGAGPAIQQVVVVAGIAVQNVGRRGARRAEALVFAPDLVVAVATIDLVLVVTAEQVIVAAKAVHEVVAAKAIGVVGAVEADEGVGILGAFPGADTTGLRSNSSGHDLPLVFRRQRVALTRRQCNNSGVFF